MPHKTIAIRRLIRTGERCPSQWEATTEDGLYLYVRYRWGCLEIGMGPSMHDAIENSGNVFEKQLGSNLDGSMDLEGLRKATSGLIAWPSTYEDRAYEGGPPGSKF
jgi:hypothetical protein